MSASKKNPKSITSEELLLPQDEPSLLFAQRELIRTNGINFEQWWDEFKLGFVNGKRSKDTNYQSGLWTKPKYVNITPITSTSGAMTIEYWPNKDKPGNSYLLSGTVSDIIRGIMDTMRTSNTQIKFEDWFEKWEKGFPEFKSDRAVSNYAIKNTENQFHSIKELEIKSGNQWKRIKEPQTRPRYRELTNPQQRADIGYRVIEYWKDRSNEAVSVIMVGTNLMLINQIVQYEYQGSIAAAPEQSITSDVIRYSGIPEITLYFKGVDKSNPQVPQTVKGEKSFRLMGYTDNPTVAQKRDDLELIKEVDINRIATKIKTIFGTSPAYNWSKGKKLVTYHDWSRGYNFNIYCSNHIEGDRLLAALLAVRELEVDETFVKYSQAKNPAKAYPPVSEIEILGKKHKTEERLPLVDVAYKYATIYLPTIKETQYIA